MLFCAIAALAFCVISKSEEKLTPQKALLKKLGATKALIINGDDFGYSDDINAGILRGFKEGIITSSSLMMPSKSLKGALKIIAENPGLDVGVHLVLAQDAPNDPGPLSPAEKVPTLVGPDGLFPTTIVPIARAGKDQILMELTAQLDAALAAGVDVTHFDCHKGFYHNYDPKMLKIILGLAAKYRLPIRWQGSSSDPALSAKGIITPDHLTTIDIQGPLAPKKEKLLKMINNLPDGITEIILHPAEGDPAKSDRATLLALALDPDIKAAIQKNAIRLIGYRELRDLQRQSK